MTNKRKKAERAAAEDLLLRYNQQCAGITPRNAKKRVEDRRKEVRQRRQQREMNRYMKILRERENSLAELKSIDEQLS